MNSFEKKEVIQAVLIADTNAENLRPLSDTNSTALLPLVNVALLDYALEALNRSGIEEVFVYASLHLQSVREHIKRGMDTMSTWSVNMAVHVIGGEGSRCFGDAMRDLDAKALIRGNFILLSTDTVTNADFRPIIEQHKKFVKYDRGAAATIIFKEAVSGGLRTGNEVMIAYDTQNQRLHHQQRLRLNNKEVHFEVPLEVFMLNSQVTLMHNLLDPQMAIGSPSMLSLFSDNFDFETRDDFVRGILINEDILDSRIYVSLLPREQYARTVNNWLAYQIVSRDIINRWAYPLVPDMGVHCLTQQYIFLRNNIYKSPTASVAKVVLSENVVLQADSVIEAGTSVSCSVIGRSCKVGQNCRLSHAFLMDNVSVEDGCVLEYCVIGPGVHIGANAIITGGTVVGGNSIVPPNTKLEKVLIKSTKNINEDDDVIVQVLGDRAYIIDDKQQTSAYASDSENEDSISIVGTGIPKMMKLSPTYAESDYNSTSDEDDESQRGSPMLDDTKIFLSEVMDSLARGFQEKSNPDFLILEINSSRYAYNMSLQEVNFNVVKALFSLQNIKEPPNGNVIVAVHSVLKQLGPVMVNYIKTYESMLDCLQALEDICQENSFVRDKISQILHYLYDKDFITEDAIMAWYEQLDAIENQTLKRNLRKLIDWLSQPTDEEDDENDDDDSD